MCQVCSTQPESKAANLLGRKLLGGNMPHIEQIGTYALKSSNGRHIRMATFVRFSDGQEIRFIDKMSKQEAARQAVGERSRQLQGTTCASQSVDVLASRNEHNPHHHVAQKDGNRSDSVCGSCGRSKSYHFEGDGCDQS